MTTLAQMLEELAARHPASAIQERPEPQPHCLTHGHNEPCPQCTENRARGYAVKQLAGRCADGFERGKGTLWHAVKLGEYAAICGATYGRRSAGWSSYEPIGGPVTCPKCLKRLSRAGA